MYITRVCGWITVTRTVKAALVSVTAVSLFAFSCFTIKLRGFQLNFGSQLQYLLSVQVLPRRSRYRWGSLMVIYLFLHWSIWQALLLLFGICISAVWRQQKRKKKNAYKKLMIVMLNLVLIDVICVCVFHSKWFYMCNVRLYMVFVYCWV